ncbi:hypothetical protein IJG91_00905, partial [Candidatus Saccharibacteria bacterium]|nr:hypothetical protein [Candidatus Saccharibacteria bacterium]
NFWTITNMQDMTPEICASVKTPSNAVGSNVNVVVLDTDNAGTVPGAKATYTVSNMAEYNNLVTAANQPYVAQRTLYDIRDSKPYTVRKLADGNCWMTNNLALELEANKNYTGVNNGTGEEIIFNTGNTCAADSTCIMNSNTRYVSTTGFWYYSWYAATAGTGNSSMVDEETTYSICPANWRLPANYSKDTEKSWGALTDAYGMTTSGTDNNNNNISKFNSLPISSAFTSNYYVGSLTNSAMNDSMYWSSTAYTTATYAYRMRYNSGYTGPQNYARKYVGNTVRCVAL